MNRGFYLSLRMGFFNPDPVPQAVIDALTEVQVTASTGSQGGFQMKFTLGKNSPIEQSLLPSGFFDPRTRVIIVVTVQGTPYVLMDGIITKQDVTPSSDPGKSTLTVTGLDLTALMDFIDLTGIPYPAIPMFTIIDLILAKYAFLGVVPVVIPNIISLIQNPIERIRKQQGTDYAYINALAQRYGHVFHLDPGPSPGMSIAYWGPSISLSNPPQPALTVNMDAATNVDALSFSYDGLAAKQYIVTILEPNTKIPIPIPIPDISAIRPTLAQKSATPLKSQVLGEMTKFSLVEAALVTIGALTSSSNAITGNGSLDVIRYGHVLQARKNVGVRGAGTLYDGLYHVKSVTHNIKRGEYKQNFSLERGGVISSVDKVDV